MKKKEGPEARLAMILMRSIRSWDQAELARVARIAPSQISVYDRGERAIPREALERMAVAAGLPLPLLDPLLRSLRSFRAAIHGWSEMEGRMFDEFSAKLIGFIGDGLKVVIPFAPVRDDPFRDWSRPPRAEDRRDAAALWKRLARATPAQRNVLVDEAEEFQSWALCERVADESVAVAPADPREALALAELACRIADLAPGSETWRRRLQGYAWAAVSHARRAGGDLDGAGEALSLARRHWKAGNPGDPGNPGLLSPKDPNFGTILETPGPS